MGRKRVLVLVSAVLAVLLIGGFAGYKAYRLNQDAAALALACDSVTSLNVDTASRRAEAAGASPKIAVLGDSYAQGQHLADPLRAFPYELATQLDATVTVDAIGGTGYVRGGPCGGQELGTRLERVLARDPEILVIEAGINDAAVEGLSYAANVLYDRVEQDAPYVRVVVIGPFAPVGGPDVNLASASIEAAAESHGYEFVDPRSWDFPVLEDGLHPTREGHQIIGHRLVTFIRS